MASRRSRNGAELELMSRHHFEVATWVAVWEVVTWSLTLRPGNLTVAGTRSRHKVDVATEVSLQEVATWN